MLRILNESLEVIGTIPNCTSISLSRRFCDVGSFEIQLLQSICPNFIKDGVYIRFRDFYGIISYFYQDDAYVTIKGYDLKGLLKQRVAFGNKSGAAETVIKAYVSENTEGNRAFPLFCVASDRATGDEISNEIAKAGERLDNVIKNICEAHKIGYDVFVSDGKLCFDVVEPKVKSATFWKRKNNIGAYEYTYDRLNEVNSVYRVLTPSGFKITAKKEGSSWTETCEGGTACFKNGSVYKIEEKLTIGATSSAAKHYFYARLTLGNEKAEIIASNVPPSEQEDSKGQLYMFLGFVDDDGNVLNNEVSERVVIASDDSFSGLLRKEGILSLSGDNDENAEALAQFLSDNAAQESIEAEILSFDGYKSEWNLGDFVNIKLEAFGEILTVSRQISEITEVFESGNHRLSLVFGSLREGILRKIAKGRLKL